MFTRSVAPGGQSVDQVPPTATSQRVASFDEVNIKSKKAYREQLSTRISAKQQNLKGYEAHLKRQRKHYLPDIAHFASDRYSKYEIDHQQNLGADVFQKDNGGPST